MYKITAILYIHTALCPPGPAMLVCAGVYFVVSADWPGAGPARSLGWPGLIGGWQGGGLMIWTTARSDIHQIYI